MPTTVSLTNVDDVHDILYEMQVKTNLHQQLMVLEEIRVNLQAEGIDVPGIVVCGKQSGCLSSWEPCMVASSPSPLSQKIGQHI